MMISNDRNQPRSDSHHPRRGPGVTGDDHETGLMIFMSRGTVHCFE